MLPNNMKSQFRYDKRAVLGSVLLRKDGGTTHYMEVQHRIYGSGVSKIALVQRTDYSSGHGTVVQPKPSYTDLLEFDPVVFLGLSDVANDNDVYEYVRGIVSESDVNVPGSA